MTGTNEKIRGTWLRGHLAKLKKLKFVSGNK